MGNYCNSSVIKYYINKKFKKVPDKRQTVMEMMLDLVRNLVNENMGEEFKVLFPL